MNTTLQVLLTALLVGGGIGGYHLLTADQSVESHDALNPDHDRRMAALEDRVRELEGQGPVLQGSVDVQSLWEQMQRLGERVDAMERPAPAAGPRVSADLAEPADVEPTAAEASIAGADGTPSPLSEAEEKRVRELLQDTMRDRMQAWANRRLDRTLGELGIELTADQREKLNQTIGEHMQSVREAMQKAREDGVPREERRELMAPLNEQLTQQISEFLPIVDAEAITKALPAPGRGGGGPGGGRGPR